MAAKVSVTRFGVHAVVSNLFNLGRHRLTAEHYRELRREAFASWDMAVAVREQSGGCFAVVESQLGNTRSRQL